MNCQSCNTRVDYRFLTNCAECGCAIEADGAAHLQSLPDVPPLESFRKRLTWKRRLANVGYGFFCASSFMIAGAVVVWVVAGVAMKAIIDMVDPVQTPGEYCGLGMAVGFFSLIGGALLGTIVGSVIAIKRPLYKA